MTFGRVTGTLPLKAPKAAQAVESSTLFSIILIEQSSEDIDCNEVLEAVTQLNERLVDIGYLSHSEPTLEGMPRGPGWRSENEAEKTFIIAGGNWSKLKSLVDELSIAAKLFETKVIPGTQSKPNPVRSLPVPLWAKKYYSVSRQ